MITRHETLEALNAQLLTRLEGAEETIRAIQQGAVDAFVLEELGKHRVYTLEGADRPYLLFIEQMQQGVATLHADGAIVYCNRRLSEIVGVVHEKVVGALLRDFVVLDDRAAFDAMFREGPGTAGGEVRLRKPDGELVPVHLMSHVLPLDSRKLIGVFVTDLTAQKQHEQLAAAQAALREADRRKNEFLATLAHELRNPLAPIRNAVTILRLAGGDEDVVQATSEMLERQVRQMVRLVDDLLDISRITRNKIELRKERVDLAGVIEQAVECARPLCSDMDHELSVSLPKEPVFIDGDPVRLTQVFANLLDNGCKYMDRGGRISLTVTLSPREVDGSGEVSVRVRDQGMGIAADQLTRIFDMFTQVDSSLERARSGLGIGLTLVASLVQMHGGRVEVHSDGEGKGSEFTVHLPIQREPAAQQAGPPAEQPTMTYRILVVDDNRDSAESLAQLLKLTGHETYTALDGLQAVEVAEQVRPEVVLLDIGMPKLNGYDACRRIRTEPWSKGMMLIAQTGWGQDDDRQRTEQAGFDGHLVKPVDPSALMRLLAALSAARER
jgi:PAS domain S-box-containing protein